MTGWWAVVPVKDARVGKSRLAGVLADDARADLVREMAAATVGALLGSSRVAGVVLVTPDVPLARRLAGPDVVVVGDPGPPPGDAAPGPHAGLDAAVLAGARHALAVAPGAPVVVVLGDLPSLTPTDVDAVLADAARWPRAHVADAAGTGTTVLTATWPWSVRPSFGPGSSARHAAAGHVLLDVPPTSGARHDVDVAADLDPSWRAGAGTVWRVDATASNSSQNASRSGTSGVVHDRWTRPCPSSGSVHTS